ncbi:MAG TPA: tetratricopeptide repeat protein, partial [Planctomycetota bacterium]|nr:tetratricopeptide repeat protein [Planctomycetota bacterium]
AFAVVGEIVQSCRTLGGVTALELALSVNTRLQSTVPPRRAEWRRAAGTQLDLLDALARAVFTENVRLGRDDLNAKVSEPQQRYLAVLATLQREDPAEAPGLLKQLNNHLKGWVAHGHYETAQTMLEELAKSLPLKEQREAQLEVARLWVRKVFESAARRQAAGLAVPRELDPDAARAAERLYALQRGLDETDPFLAAARGELNKLVAHYVKFEYDDVAEKVLTTRVAPPIALADTWASLQLIEVRFGKAARDFERSLAAYGAREKITLTPALTEVVTAYTKFITDHPTDRLVPGAASGVFRVAQLMEKHKAHLAAAGVYGDFARFAATVKPLSESAPGTPSLAESAGYHRALALDGHARQVLAKTLADQGPDAKPPAKLSDEFTAALDAWKSFLVKYPTGPLAAAALKQTELIAFEHARLDAWDAAEAVYADMIASLKTLDAPERLQLARGLCRLGSAMPDHARTTLATLLGQPVAKPAAPDKTPPAILSDDEITRQQKAVDAAYVILIDVMRTYPNTTSATRARVEILTMVAHWRTIGRSELAAALGTCYLADHPTDVEMPKLRLAAARDLMSWAARPVTGDGTPQERLVEVTARFEKARAELSRFAADFPVERTLVQQAQWESAASWLVQARAVAAFSPTLALGQYVRAAREMQRVGERFGDHPNVAQVPQMLWNIGAELQARGDFAEAVVVWNILTLHHPTHALSQQAALRIAQVYELNLAQPLKAAELYQEIWFARGGVDGNLPVAIFNIGSQLRQKKRWIEALHVLESFVDSFPRHPSAGQALTTIGQIHQANEAWTDAIEAYRRVIEEYPGGNWVHEAKWSIAECTLNLSRWQEATEAYNTYLAAYPTGHNSAEAKRRIEILKDLQRYQTVVDEPGQRKAFDAQFQIAAIVRDKLSNPVKAIIEYRKVATDWGDSHLADDALYAVGTTYLSIGETEKAREALLLLASRYATSPLADDALHMVGQTYEQEAQRLAGMDREKQLQLNEEVAQRHAYSYAQDARRQVRGDLKDAVKKLKEEGRPEAAALAEAQGAANAVAFDRANVYLAAGKAQEEVERVTAAEF